MKFQHTRFRVNFNVTQWIMMSSDFMKTGGTQGRPKPIHSLSSKWVLIILECDFCIKKNNKIISGKL